MGNKIKAVLGNGDRFRVKIDDLENEEWQKGKGYLLFASLLTFIVSFMDGVDGKLSRVKISSSHTGKMEQTFEDIKKGYQLVDYGKPERTFRKFDGRKNTYIILILVGVLLNAPFYSLIIITSWSFVSAGFYCLRAMKHLHMLDRKEHL